MSDLVGRKGVKSKRKRSSPDATVKKTSYRITHTLAQHDTPFINNIFIQFYIPDMSKLPVALHIPEITNKDRQIDVDSFAFVAGNSTFCNRGDYMDEDYIRDSAMKSHMIILLTIPEKDVLIGFIAIYMRENYIYIKTLCGDATFSKISNVLIGVVEWLCTLCGISKMELTAVPDQVNTYKHFGFLIDDIKSKPGNLPRMVNDNNFKHIYPLSESNEPVQMIDRRTAKSGRSPRHQSMLLSSPVVKIVSAAVMDDILENPRSASKSLKSTRKSPRSTRKSPKSTRKSPRSTRKSPRLTSKSKSK